MKIVLDDAHFELSRSDSLPNKHDFSIDDYGYAALSIAELEQFVAAINAYIAEVKHAN